MNNKPGQKECRDEQSESFQLSPVGMIELATPLLNVMESGDDRDATLLNLSPVGGNDANNNVGNENVNDSTHDHLNASFPDHDIEINIPESAHNDTSTSNNNDEDDVDEEEETEEQRMQREIEESEALARQLMAEEAMASYAASSEFLRDNADQFSEEDLAALHAAMAEEDPETPVEEEGEGEEEGNSQEMSYDALLRLGERIGDVKEERWAMIAQTKIKQIPTLLFDSSMAVGKDENHTEVKCLICQFPYEDEEELRRLPCSHCFHKECVDSWLSTKDTCALCRKSIVPEK